MRFAIKSPDAELPSICRWLTSSCQGRSGRLNLNLKSGKSSWNFDHIPRKHISPPSIPTDALKMSLSHLQHIACNGQTTHHESLHLWKEAKVSSYCSYSHAWRHMPSSRAEELCISHSCSPQVQNCVCSHSRQQILPSAGQSLFLMQIPQAYGFALRHTGQTAAGEMLIVSAEGTKPQRKPLHFREIGMVPEIPKFQGFPRSKHLEYLLPTLLC